MYHLVNVVDGNNQAFKDMGTLTSLAQIILGATDSDIVTMLDKILHALFQSEQTRTAFDQSNIVDRERALKGCHLEQLVEQDIGIGVTLAVDNDAHTLTARLVVHISHTLYFMFVCQIGNIFHKVSLVDAIRNLSNDNLVMCLSTLDFGLGTHDDASATSLVCVTDTCESINIGTSREVRSWDVFHQTVRVDIRIVNVGTTTVNNLAQVMGRHVGGHTDGNTITTIDQQVGYLSRHDAWLDQRIVEVVDHIHSLLVQVVHDMLTHLRETAFRVTHGRRRVTVYRTKVTLSVD